MVSWFGGSRGGIGCTVEIGTLFPHPLGGLQDYKLWKPRFDDLIIKSERQLKIKMEYIHNNPVKTGLVGQAEHWQYSSAIDWLTVERGLIKVDKDYQWLVES